MYETRTQFSHEVWEQKVYRRLQESQLGLKKFLSIIINQKQKNSRTSIIKIKELLIVLSSPF